MTKKAIQETIRICLERDILVPFLTSRREEVIDIMEMLFSQEEVWEMERRYIMKEGMEKGLLLAIKGLMESSGMTAESAMSSLKIAAPDRPRYMELLNQPKQ